ncbi:signal peptide-containing [Cryptosporidium sp. chipmunk genotype I]|uniref:signal peptide-containing n=1 Tax=Cryptosporidium sp. chipmunk genotype I TaxID=1280935 RepID=UPI00351A5D74|nr:signal peptide-containing [Cryptosporidium sp. chipmunk genotype I]
MISAIIESANTSEANAPRVGKDTEFDINNNRPKNFKQGNKRWFKAKKDLMKFTPQKGIELGKKIARNASIGVIWVYEPGLLLAEELVSPCFGIISYYPNVQVTVMKGERFLGIICDARDYKPINTDRFKWYVAIGNDLAFTARYYVKEGAYIKEGQELGHLSRPARSVGRVAIKSRARCSGIIVLCKTGPVETGEEFLRISCDAAPGTADVNNSLVDKSHTSLLDQSDMGKSIPKLRGLAQISPEEANYDGKQLKLPQVMNSGEDSDILDDEKSESEEEELITKKNTKDFQNTKKEEKIGIPLDSSNTLDESIASSNSDLKIINKAIQPPSDDKKGKNFFDLDFEEEEDDGINDDTEYKKMIDNEFKEKNQKESEKSADKEKLEKERLERERLEKERLQKEILEKERLKKEKLEKERLEKERLEKAGTEKKVVDTSPSILESADYHVILQKHRSKEDKSKKQPEKKTKEKQYNKIDSVKTGDVLDLDGLSSSIVSEAEISILD